MISIALAFTLWLAPGQMPKAQLHAAPFQTPPDAWFAEDKLKHTFMSLATVGFAHAGTRALGLDSKGGALVVAVGAGTVAALGKEVHDRRQGGPFSVRDLAWDAVGIALGALVMANTRE